MQDFWALTTAVAIAITLFGHRPRLIAAENPAESMQLIITGISDRIERTGSGSVYITGEKELADADGFHEKGPVEISCSFSNGLREFRFDRKEFHVFYDFGTRDKPPSKRSNSTHNKPSRPPADTRRVARSLETRYMRTPEESGSYFEDSPSLMLSGPLAKPIKFVMPFDPRCIGLFFIVDQVKPPRAEFPDILKQYLSTAPTDISEDDNGITRIEWEHGAEVRQVLWLDKPNGFTPLRHELQLRDESVKGKVQWHPPIYTALATWTHKSDTWVPITCFLETVLTAEREGVVIETMRESYRLQFDWTNVNKEISPDVFTPDNVAPAGASITDTRVTPALVIRGRNAGLPGTNRRMTLPVSRTPWRLLVVAGNVIVILLLLILLACRRKRLQSR